MALLHGAHTTVCPIKLCASVFPLFSPEMRWRLDEAGKGRKVIPWWSLHKYWYHWFMCYRTNSNFWTAGFFFQLFAIYLVHLHAWQAIYKGEAGKGESDLFFSSSLSSDYPN